MSIKNRLKKLESEVQAAGEFCACDKDSKEKIVCAYADDGVLRNPKEAEAEYCAVCALPVNKKVIIVDFVSDWKTETRDYS